MREKPRVHLSYELRECLTIPRDTKPPLDPQMLALAALAWVLEDSARADRLLSLTGLTPEALRDGLGERPVLAAVLEFIAGHEPDLLAAADALGVAPQDLAGAAQGLAA